MSKYIVVTWRKGFAMKKLISWLIVELDKFKQIQSVTDQCYYLFCKWNRKTIHFKVRRKSNSPTISNENVWYFQFTRTQIGWKFVRFRTLQRARCDTLISSFDTISWRCHSNRAIETQRKNERGRERMWKFKIWHFVNATKTAAYCKGNKINYKSQFMCVTKTWHCLRITWMVSVSVCMLVDAGWHQINV